MQLKIKKYNHTDDFLFDYLLINFGRMAGCGYVCPLCEGTGIDDHGNDCTLCIPEPQNKIRLEPVIYTQENIRHEQLLIRVKAFLFPFSGLFNF
jgi:hypothetical protein